LCKQIRFSASKNSNNSNSINSSSSAVTVPRQDNLRQDCPKARISRTNTEEKYKTKEMTSMNTLPAWKNLQCKHKEEGKDKHRCTEEFEETVRLK